MTPDEVAALHAWHVALTADPAYVELRAKRAGLREALHALRVRGVHPGRRVINGDEVRRLERELAAADRALEDFVNARRCA